MWTLWKADRHNVQFGHQWLWCSNFPKSIRLIGVAGQLFGTEKTISIIDESHYHHRCEQSSPAGYWSGWRHQNYNWHRIGKRPNSPSCSAKNIEFNLWTHFFFLDNHEIIVVPAKCQGSHRYAKTPSPARADGFRIRIRNHAGNTLAPFSSSKGTNMTFLQFSICRRYSMVSISSVTHPNVKTSEVPLSAQYSKMTRESTRTPISGKRATSSDLIR